MTDNEPRTGDQMIRRARNVAAGLADVGLSQAEEMLRRLSPEGRAQARRERQARARRHKQLAIRIMFAALAAMLVWASLALVVMPELSMLAAAVTMALLTTLIIARAKPRTPGREALVGAALPGLTDEATVWLAAQRRGLPAPAVGLTDTLACRLDELAPQLARLDPHEPAADAVRTLIATELPGLVDGWRAVPASLRGVRQADGRTPDARLVDGLRLIDSEVARMTEQLARGALDEVATHGRYLELKYRGDDLLSGHDVSPRRR